MSTELEQLRQEIEAVVLVNEDCHLTRTQWTDRLMEVIRPHIEAKKKEEEKLAKLQTYVKDHPPCRGCHFQWGEYSPKYCQVSLYVSVGCKRWRAWNEVANGEK